jgi:tripartite-type tricarboxylate transporter receptor subunit TctC
MSLDPHRRRFVLAAAGTCLCAGPSSAALAQTYPGKPIQLVVPYAAGGGTDVAARILAEGLGKVLGQTVVVDNRGGANGLLGTDLVRRAAPDGYTVLFTISSLVQNPLLYAKANYDPFKDFIPVAELARQPIVFAASKKLGATTIQEFIRRAAAQPGKLTYGSFGNGSSAHIYTEMMQDVKHVQLIHVPYRGAAPAMQDLLGGNIDATYLIPSIAVQQASSGASFPLLITGDQRSPILPNVPTFKEFGVEGAASSSWYGVFLPANTPREIVDRLGRAVLEVAADAKYRGKLDGIGAVPTGATGEALGHSMKTDYQQWKEVIRAKNIKVE